MDKKRIHQPIKTFLRRVRQDISVDKAILFGSAADGKITTPNDIDVLVVSKDFKHWDEDRRLDLLYDKSKFIKPEIHPWGITPEELAVASRLTTLGYARDHGIIIANE